ncbi:anti-repressor SinI family protein [Aquibacillus sp. 3ASR75-11]|uniref:Anti-repressor SinI family protein n=1 Tax=Terrihalobacillus insolitus TaxID=2950438 RepID=A0A9X4ANK0_9BACI|nr:anti-repressor SinI family protein [Terrihalobacillus insolitus]MDC3413628.1 anti-repressor SinI family protein [Terrihalobacillus insolitus]MDC3424615.1 anti-repressor SinI family protein [Terrihalobacillus insolitus]
MVIETGERIDKEWVGLILTAKKIGLTPEEIHSYLQQASTSNQESSK